MSRAATETDPLLCNASAEPEPEIAIEEVEVGNVKLFITLFVDSVPGEAEFQIFFSWSTETLNLLVTTVILSYILQNSIQTVAILVAGRLGPDALSAAAFSYMLAFVTGELSS